MAQFEVNEDTLVAATAAKVAAMCVQDASFVARLVAGAIGGLLSSHQLRETYDAGVKKALDNRIAQAQVQISAIPVDLVRWQRMAQQEEDRWRSHLYAAASEVITEAKTKMSRTIRKAVNDLLKDRVDEMLKKLVV